MGATPSTEKKTVTDLPEPEPEPEPEAVEEVGGEFAPVSETAQAGGRRRHVTRRVSPVMARKMRQAQKARKARKTQKRHHK